MNYTVYISVISRVVVEADSSSEAAALARRSMTDGDIVDWDISVEENLESPPPM